MKGHLGRWFDEYAKKGLVILDIHPGRADSKEKIEAMIGKTKAKYAIARDEDSHVIKAFGVRAFAAAVLVGVDGKVAWQGFPANKVDQLEGLFKKELEKVSKDELKKIEQESK